MVDIYDINYEHCSEKLGILNLPADNLPRKGIFFRILSQVKATFMYGLKNKTKESIAKGKTLFFVMSQNEINSITPIAKKLPESSIFGIDRYKNGFPLFGIYFLSLFFIPVVAYRLLICKNPYHKKAFNYAFDGFCIAYASKYILKKYLVKVAPEKIIIANQLSCFHRSLAYVAKELSIPTFYIQHASVTENFADLNIFSTALLEGEDSLRKYQANGSRNKTIYLVGMPKFDKYFGDVKDNQGVSMIGICTNGMDKFEPFADLITYLKDKLPNTQVVIRPHPSDRRFEKWKSLANENGCMFSNVREVESFQFFKSINFIISGDSNIHLEAALLNIPSIYFDSVGNKVDWYGFAANKLVPYSTEPYSIYTYIREINKKLPDIRNNAKFYVETIDTMFDGKSAELVAMIINNAKVETYFNKLTDGSSNQIYRIKE